MLKKVILTVFLDIAERGGFQQNSAICLNSFVFEKIFLNVARGRVLKTIAICGVFCPLLLRKVIFYSVFRYFLLGLGRSLQKTWHMRVFSPLLVKKLLLQGFRTIPNVGWCRTLRELNVAGFNNKYTVI